MKKILFILGLYLLFAPIISNQSYANETNEELLEQVLMISFHNKIDFALEQIYGSSVHQRKCEKVIDIKKRSIPGTEGVYNPGYVYDVTIQLLTLYDSKEELITMTVSNDNVDHMFGVVDVKRSKDISKIKCPLD